MLVLVMAILAGTSSFSRAGASPVPVKKVTMNQHNASLQVVIDQIEGQTDYLFIIQEGVDLNMKVSVEGTAMTIRDAMDKVCKSAPLTYHLEGNYIMVSRKKQDPQDESRKQRIIKGKVTDESGVPLIGVAVQVKGTQKGTVTDLDGNYTLEGDFEQDLSQVYCYHK